ncbi:MULTISPECIES: MFS transporter [unclassified Coleofasciculus]|uniref:MFS transporter n=1 Tax=unclassified Coleofasciculus TaxID=2692782 RepID=UPI00188143E3|nr:MULTISPECIES: MFS transporter [unclassified Coleofasciculus]MBE9126141.1 MFS transporter [Coleofasciculus sp. LEGE 07081]MBE9149559.1 MFS transporter [Coleofasciculus sp. LEGE 07092]
MKLFSTIEAQQRQNLLVLFATGLLFWSGLASMLPTLPPYIEDLGGTKQQVGMVMGCFAIGLLLFRPKLGHLADQRSRKLVVIIGTIVAAIAPLGYLVADSIGLLMVLRAFHGISIAAFTTGYLALVADLSPVRQRGELIGYMSLVTPVGMALGPALGGLLQGAAGYTALFLFSGGLGFLAAVCASQVGEPERVQVSQQKTAQPTLKTIWRLLTSPRLRIPATVLLLVGLAFGSLSTFIALFIRETGINLNAGWFFTAAAIASFMMRLVAGRASDRYGRGLFITGSLICYGLSMVLISQARSPQAFLLAGFIEGAGAGTLLPMMIALISDRSSGTERGQVFAACISGFDLGIAIAGPVFGAIADPLGYEGIFTLMAGLTFLALMIFITQSSKNLSHSLRFATGRERDIYALDNRI